MKKILSQGLVLLTLAFGYVGCITTSDVSSIVDKTVEKQNKVMTQMKNDYQDEFQKIKGDYQDRIKQLKREYEKELEKMKKNSDFEKMKANSDANFEKMKNNYDGKLEQILEDLKKPENKGYDNSSAKLTDKTIDQMLDAVYHVDVGISFKHKTNGTYTAIQSGGSAFIAENKNGRQYFITCNHVVDTEQKISRLTWARDYEIHKTFLRIEKDSDIILVDILRQNKDKDLAVLISKTDRKIEKKIDFADKELERGDVVFAVGYPVAYAGRRRYELGKLLTKGAVLGSESYVFPNIFFVNSDLNHGNSGGPIYVLENGIPKFAGVSSVIVRANGVYGAIHYKHAKKELDKAIKNYEAKQKQTQSQPQTKDN